MDELYASRMLLPRNYLQQDKESGKNSTQQFDLIDNKHIGFDLHEHFRKNQATHLYHCRYRSNVAREFAQRQEWAGSMIFRMASQPSGR